MTGVVDDDAGRDALGQVFEGGAEAAGVGGVGGGGVNDGAVATELIGELGERLLAAGDERDRKALAAEAASDGCA